MSMTIKGQEVIVKPPTPQGVVHVHVGGRDVLQLDLENSVRLAKRLEDETSEYTIDGANGETVMVEWEAVRARGNQATVKKNARKIAIFDTGNARAFALLLRGYLASEDGIEVETKVDPTTMDAEDKARRTLDDLHEGRTGTRGKLMLADYDHTVDLDPDTGHLFATLRIGQIAPPAVIDVEWGDEIYRYTREA